MGEPREYFLTSYHFFRDVMCSTKFTLEQKENAFISLTQDYIRCITSPDDGITFQAIAEEWSRRRMYELFKPALLNGEGGKETDETGKKS